MVHSWLSSIFFVFAVKGEPKEMFRRVSPVDVDQLIITHLRSEEEVKTFLERPRIFGCNFYCMLSILFLCTADIIRRLTEREDQEGLPLNSSTAQLQATRCQSNFSILLFSVKIITI